MELPPRKVDAAALGGAASVGTPPSPWGAARARPRPRRKRPWLRRLGQTAAALLVALLLLWIAIHRIPWLGPALAEGARALFGARFVAWVEDVAYGIQDRVDRWRYGDRPPKAFWEVPSAAGSSASPAPATSSAQQPGAGGGDPAADAPAFFPRPFEPPFPEVAAAADGIWVPISDPGRPTGAVPMYKTMVHSDPRRPYAVLAVAAIDTRALDLELQAGTHEPQSNRVLRAERPGVVPPEQASRLVAAFNGGFRATHGQYGMMLGGKEYLPPRDFACTLARYRDGALRIGIWSALKADVGQMRFYRQTPPCLVEQGDTHQLLKYQEYAKGWGATVSGETVIRRSAIGLDRDRQVLYYGIGDGMTAQAIARGMLAAGAHDAAELDVNYAYPRFLLYEQRAAEPTPRAGSALIPGIDFAPEEYVARPCERDFFYLLRVAR
jgi:hypothetical protein